MTENRTQPDGASSAAERDSAAFTSLCGTTDIHTRKDLQFRTSTVWHPNIFRGFPSNLDVWRCNTLKYPS